MRLTSATDLKNQLMKDLRATPGTACGYSEPHGVSSGVGVGQLPQPQVGVFLGIAPVKRDEFCLAIRIHELDSSTMQLVAHLQEEASGETDIRMVGRIEALCHCGPLATGFSAAHSNVGAGTIGPIVTVGDDRALCAVSNNHVFANCNQADNGDSILHPSFNDHSLHNCDRIGTLVGSIDLLVDQPNQVDAALCHLDGTVDVDPRINSILPTLADEIYEGLAVEKVGRTTGHTHGTVTAFGLDGVPVDYSPVLGTITFDEQVEVRSDEAGGRFSAQGDSGSLVFHSPSMEAIGLLFAGSIFPGNDGYATFVNPLPAVLSHLHAKLVD